MPKTTDRVSDAAGTVKPYVDRAIHDRELRESVTNAVAAARDVYNELLGGRSMTNVATRVATDKDIQDNLRRAVDELRHAADRIQGKSSHTGRNAMLLGLGILIGLLANPMTGPGTRRWIKGRVFGDGDEFGYGGGNSPSANGA